MKIPEILQVETPHSPGALASVLNVLAETGLVARARAREQRAARSGPHTLWEITVEIDTQAHAGLVERLNTLLSARFIGWSDRVSDRHRGGKIEMRSRVAISTQQILRDTPSAKSCTLII